MTAVSERPLDQLVAPLRFGAAPAAGHNVTVTDFFCGAGGSSTGAAAVPGVRVVMASNHWKLAIESHNTNHPDTDHDIADLSGVDPRRYPRTDIAWFSPECTTWSQARGRRRDYADQASLFDAPLPDEATVRSRATMGDVIRFTEHHRYEVVIVENVVDIRAWTLWDEWIGEMRKLGYQHREVYMNSMHAWGVGPATPQSRDRIYVVFWKVGNRAPNFDKWLSPPAWCPNCAEWVRARQWWKDPAKQSGKYGARAQYLYRCPTERCHQVLDPAALPAAVAIDWSLPAQRIGERAKPLAPKTRARIAAGIKRYARPFTLEAAGHTFERTPGVRTWPADSPLTTLTGTATRAIACPPMLVPAGGSWRDEAVPVTEPMSTRTTRENDGLAVPPLLVPVEGRDGKHARPAGEPMRTQTGRGETGLALPSFLVPLRSGRERSQTADQPLSTIVANGGNHGIVNPFLTVHRGGPDEVRTHDPNRAFPTFTSSGNFLGVVQPFLTTLRGDHPQDSPLSDPMATVCASGNHLGLVMRNNTARADDGYMSTPVTEPFRTLTTAGHQSVLTCPQDALYSYDTGRLNGLGQPLPTQTTIDGDALMHLADMANLDDPDVLQRIVDECTFRMLAPAEMALGMAFPHGYVVLGNKGERTKQIGNAVTPPVARDLIAAAVEAITGEEISA